MLLSKKRKCDIKVAMWLVSLVGVFQLITSTGSIMALGQIRSTTATNWS